MSNETERPQQQTGAYVAIGVLLLVAGIFMTGGTRPLVGLIFAIAGIAVAVVGLVRRR